MTFFMIFQKISENFKAKFTKFEILKLGAAMLSQALRIVPPNTSPQIVLVAQI